jgi:hypothetical protein
LSTLQRRTLPVQIAGGASRQRCPPTGDPSSIASLPRNSAPATGPPTCCSSSSRPSPARIHRRGRQRGFVVVGHGIAAVSISDHSSSAAECGAAASRREKGNRLKVELRLAPVATLLVVRDCRGEEGDVVSVSSANADGLDWGDVPFCKIMERKKQRRQQRCRTRNKRRATGRRRRLTVSALSRNHWGMGRFCLPALASATLVRKVFWEGCGREGEGDTRQVSACCEPEEADSVCCC